jgi:hypothetical protein
MAPAGNLYHIENFEAGAEAEPVYVTALTEIDTFIRLTNSITTNTRIVFFIRYPPFNFQKRGFFMPSYLSGSSLPHLS